MNPHSLWQQVLAALRQQIAGATFDTWLRSTEGISIDDGVLVVGTPNAYAKEWIEQRLMDVVNTAVARLSDPPLGCRFVALAQRNVETAQPVIDGRATFDFQQTRLPDPPVAAPNHQTRFNPRYSFDTFVVGSGSRLAQAAAQAVAEHPAARYNPLFIYGGVGLGKTHLLHAIGGACQDRGLRVIMVSSETFTNDLINAIRGHSTEEFRSFYRAADVLLVDDIHFIAGKESTQEEFFHTFNAVHGAEGQIVMTSDRSPGAISTLEDRLRSRFQWGLLVDIEPPDLETRIAILRDKTARHTQPVSDAVIDLIANAVQRNVRELEGALNRVMAYAQVNRLPLNEETAKKALADLMIQRDPPAMSVVLQTVAKFYGIEESELTGRRRVVRIAEPRQVAMYLMREETEASFPAIGAVIGGRDHSTIFHGCEKIGRLIEQDSKLRRDVMQIRERLYGSG